MTTETNYYQTEKRAVNLWPYLVGFPVAFFLLPNEAKIITLFVLVIHLAYSIGITYNTGFIIRKEEKKNV